MYFNWKTAFFFLNYLRIKKVSRENFFYYTCQTFYIKHRPFLSRQHYSQLPATGNSTLRSQIRHGSNYSKQQRLRIWPGKSTEQFAMENFWDAKKLLNRYYLILSASSIFLYINYSRYRNMHCICALLGHYIKFLLIAIFCPEIYCLSTHCSCTSFFFSRVVLLGSIEVDQKLLFWTCVDSYHLLLAPFSRSML